MRYRITDASSDANLSRADLATRTGLDLRRLDEIEHGPIDVDGTSVFLAGLKRGGTPDQIKARKADVANAVARVKASRPSKREARLIAAALEVDVRSIFRDFDDLDGADAEPHLRPLPHETWSDAEVRRRLADLERAVREIGNRRLPVGGQEA